MFKLRYWLLVSVLLLVAAGCGGESKDETLPTRFVPPTSAETAVAGLTPDLPPTWTPEASPTALPPRPTQTIAERPTATLVILPSLTPTPEGFVPTRKPGPTATRTVIAPIDVTDETFEDEVLKSDLPVLVVFCASWFGPCKSMDPLINQIARDYRGRLRVVKIDNEQNATTAKTYEVESIPTLLIFKDGEVDQRIEGSPSNTELRQTINLAL